MTSEKKNNNLLTVLDEELKSSPSLDRSVVMGRRLNFTLGAVPLSDPFSGERITVQIPCGGKVNMVGIRNGKTEEQTCYLNVEIANQLEDMCRLCVQYCTQHSSQWFCYAVQYTADLCVVV